MDDQAFKEERSTVEVTLSMDRRFGPFVEEPPTLVETRNIQGSGNDNVYDHKLIKLCHSSLIEESHVTSINFNQVNWEKCHETVVPTVEKQTFVRERLSSDKGNQEIVILIAENKEMDKMYLI